MLKCMLILDAISTHNNSETKTEQINFEKLMEKLNVMENKLFKIEG